MVCVYFTVYFSGSSHMLRVSVHIYVRVHTFDGVSVHTKYILSRIEYLYILLRMEYMCILFRINRVFIYNFLDGVCIHTPRFRYSII